MADPKPISEGELRARLDFDDATLFDECAAEFHRVKGPGGQHRNKVASAVRLTHRPSGYVVNATERRSQHENRANALERLREAIALGARRPVTREIDWPEGVQIRDRRLRVSPKNPAYWRVIALVLDVLVGEEGQVSRAAERLDVSTSSMTRFLADHPKAWIEANRIREAHGLSPLRRS